MGISFAFGRRRRPRPGSGTSRASDRPVAPLLIAAFEVTIRLELGPDGPVPLLVNEDRRQRGLALGVSIRGTWAGTDGHRAGRRLRHSIGRPRREDPRTACPRPCLPLFRPSGLMDGWLATAGTDPVGRIGPSGYPGLGRPILASRVGPAFRDPPALRRAGPKPAALPPRRGRRWSRPATTASPRSGTRPPAGRSGPRRPMATRSPPSLSTPTGG